MLLRFEGQITHYSKLTKLSQQQSQISSSQYPVSKHIPSCIKIHLCLFYLLYGNEKNTQGQKPVSDLIL